MHHDEFYVGYLARAPRPVALFIRRTVLLLVAICAIIVVAGVLGQSPFASSVFEFGTVREFSGIIAETPYPGLWVQRPGTTGELPGWSRYHLVAFGKKGAEEYVTGLEGTTVSLRGTLVYRDGQTMIELEEGSIQPGNPLGDDHSREPVTLEELGEFTLAGEIVDAKCFLGVMNPGNLKGHKSCAIRCISGGIPPALIVTTSSGYPIYFLITSPAGQPVNAAVLPYVAEPVRMKGRVDQQGNIYYLRVDPAAIEQL